MTNENEVVSGEEMLGTDTDYVQAINELKANTVSKDQYAKLRAENKKLLDALVNGEQLDLPDKEELDPKELRAKLFDKDSQMTNLDYVDTALKLRKTLMERGERDPFLPVGDQIQETADMHDRAEKVATVLQECVDFAGGDSGIFTAELQRRTTDSKLIRKAR